LIIGAAAWMAFGIGAFLLFDLDQQIAARRAASESFDAHAHDVTAVLADIRVAQQASGADGQDVGVWRPRVNALVAAARSGVDRLAASTTSPGARAALAGAAGEMTRLAAGQRSASGDLVLTEGGRAAVAAARLVDRARADERQEAAHATEAARRWQVFTLIVAAIVGASVTLLLALSSAPVPGMDVAAAEPVSLAGIQADAAPAEGQSQEVPSVLVEASAVCAALGRAGGSRELATALERAATLMGANGLIVWKGDIDGGPLGPLVAHGYTAEALARIPIVPRTADNAVARAYRTGTLQVAAAGSPDRPGAIAAPLVSPIGCVGALTAELPDGRETTREAHVLATLFAAQVAGLLTSTAVRPAESEAGGEAAATA
jgi:hypothetical protein